MHRISALLMASTLIVGCRGASETAQESAAPEPAAAQPAPVAEPAPPAPAQPSAAAPVAAAPAPARPAAPPPSRSAAAPAPPSSSTATAAAPAQPVKPAAPPAPRFRDVAAPVGTELQLALTTAVSTATAQVESPVTARLTRAVVVDGVTIFPVGATFHGNVTEVERAGRVRGVAHLVFRFTEVSIDGQRDPVRTNGLTFEGEATKSEDATKVGAGAGIGAVIGGIVGGASGAAKGAAIGGAAGAGTVLATRGRDVELGVGAEVTATLASPFEIRVEVP
jgi:hypothetical protein